MIYGLCGYARSGKDTIADILTLRKGVTHYKGQEFREPNEKVFRRSFADALKRELKMFLEKASEKKVDFSDEETKIKFRPLLVAWGEARRALSEDCWIDEMFDTMNIRHDYVVTDVRYLNEAQVIKKTGGKIIYVRRPNCNAANETEEKSIKEIIDAGLIDSVLDNNGSIEDLEHKVKSLIVF